MLGHVNVYTCKVCGIEQPNTDGVCIEGDRRFLDYMMAHRHTSPFEFAEVTLHVRCPMDVWRQWIRHRTANVSEYSTRYSRAINEKLTTPSGEWRAQATANRQGSAGMVGAWPSARVGEPDEGGVDLKIVCPDCNHRPLHMTNIEGAHCSMCDWSTDDPGGYLSERETQLHDLAHEVYEERLAFGVAREQARKDLLLSTFTEAYWKTDLHNLLHFLSLRTDGHAQREIREYANVIAQFVEEWCPMIFAAWVEHRRDAVTFSASQIQALRAALGDMVLADGQNAAGNPVRADDFAGVLDAARVTGRARADFLRKLGLS